MGHTKCVQKFMLVSQNAQLNCLASVLYVPSRIGITVPREFNLGFASPFLSPVPMLHILAGIAPPHITRTVACRMERTRQTTYARHQLFHHQPAASRLKSRKSFMRTVTPLDSSASSSRLRLWKDSLTDVPASVKMGLEVAESLPAGYGEDWLCWRALNRLRTVVAVRKQ